MSKRVRLIFGAAPELSADRVGHVPGPAVTSTMRLQLRRDPEQRGPCMHGLEVLSKGRASSLLRSSSCRICTCMHRAESHLEHTSMTCVSFTAHPCTDTLHDAFPRVPE